MYPRQAIDLAGRGAFNWPAGPSSTQLIICAASGVVGSSFLMEMPARARAGRDGAGSAVWGAPRRAAGRARLFLSTRTPFPPMRAPIHGRVSNASSGNISRTKHTE